MSGVLVVYDDFSGGEWGRLGAKKAAKNQFSGRNVLVYQDGQIGPRPGARRLITATSGTMPNYMDPMLGRERTSTRVHMTGRESGGGNNYVWPFDTSAPGTLTNASKYGSLPFGYEYTSANPTLTVDMPDGSAIYRTTDGQGALLPGIVKITPNSTQAAIAGSPTHAEGLPIVQYGDRLVTVKSLFAGEMNVLKYSAPANFSSWPAANEIRIGADGNIIQGLYVVRNSLIIVLQDGEVYQLSGVPGVNEVLRQVMPGYDDGDYWSWHPGSATVERLDRLWMARLSARINARISPVLFGGTAQINEYEHLELGTDIATAGTNPVALPFNNATVVVVPLARSGDVAFISGSQDGDANVLMRHNNVWTKHLIAFGNGYFPVAATHMGRGRVVVLASTTQNGARGFELFSLQLAWDKVFQTGDDQYDLAQQGDLSNTPLSTAAFSLSEFWLNDGRDFQVTEIIVDATVYDVGVNSQATLTLKRHGRVDADQAYTLGGMDATYAQPQISAPGSVTAPGPAESDGGQHRTFTIRPDSNDGRAMSLAFAGIRGMAIRRITVMGDPAGVR